MWLRANSVGKWRSTCCTAKSRNPIAAADSLGSNAACAWASSPRLTDRLKALGFSGTLNTAFVERINLTLRHALAALSDVAPGPRPNSPANCSPISSERYVQ